MLELQYREATADDIESLVKLLADDPLGTTREDTSSPINPHYIDAFHHINNDPNNKLMIVEHEDSLVGMLQLTFIPYLTHTGSWRCLIEGVRIAENFRGMGMGSKFIRWAIDDARSKGCSIVQLTSDKQRPEAIKFYESLGFKATHEGFKLKL